MKILFLFCIASTIVFGDVETVIAQQTEQERVYQERQQQQQQRVQRDFEQRNGSERLPTRETIGPYYIVRRSNSDTTVHMRLEQAVYNPLTDEERARITPAEEDLKKYGDFLKKSGTGLARILPDPNCGSDFVIDLNKSECAEALPIPGRGAFFSFRLKRNFPFPYADIHFINGNFMVGGENELGIISKIGGKDIESITLNSPEIGLIRDFRITRTRAEIKRQQEQVKRGYLDNGFGYSTKAPMEVNQTYVVRTVAFRHYDQLFNDKRRDILVAFRVLRQDSDGAVTIVWRELDKNSSPRIYK